VTFTLATRIGIVVIDGPVCRFSYLIVFDSSGVGSKGSPFIATAIFFFFGTFQ
jgi:hypothetical protein